MFCFVFKLEPADIARAPALFSDVSLHMFISEETESFPVIHHMRLALAGFLPTLGDVASACAVHHNINTTN